MGLCGNFTGKNNPSRMTHTTHLSVSLDNIDYLTVGMNVLNVTFSSQQIAWFSIHIQFIATMFLRAFVCRRTGWLSHDEVVCGKSCLHLAQRKTLWFNGLDLTLCREIQIQTQAVWSDLGQDTKIYIDLLHPRVLRSINEVPWKTNKILERSGFPSTGKSA